MTRPTRFIIRMVLFLVATTAVAAVLYTVLWDAFQANVPLNALILGVLLLGIVLVFRQVLMLGREISWLEQFQRAEKQSGISMPDPPPLIAPIARMLQNRAGRGSLSALALRSILDSLSSRLDEGREISRYFIGLLVFLGLLGTFYGLLQTVGSVGDTISSLQIGEGEDALGLFDSLKQGLEAPLSGMGTAFASSLFGLAGSLILGFLDLQAGQAQNRFYNELEEWLSGMTRLSGGGPIVEAEGSVPAYVQALLEQTADSLDSLQRTLARTEEGRSGANQQITKLIDRLSTLTDQMRAEQSLLAKLAEHQIEMKPVLTRLAGMGESSGGGMDQASRNHLRNIDVYLGRALEEMAIGRTQVVEDIRAEIKLLARTLAAMAEETRRNRDH